MLSVYLYKNLLVLRKLNDWTQDEMLSRCGVKRANWSNYENGNTEPDIQTLVNIAKAFNVSLDDLVLRNFELEVKNGNLNSKNLASKIDKNGKVNSNLKGNLNDQNRGYPSAEDRPETLAKEGEDVGTWAVLGAIKGVDEKLDGLRLLVEKALKK